MPSKISITRMGGFAGKGERMNATQYLIVIALTLALPGFAQEQGRKTQERIGVYDPRAVAVAYVGSAFKEAK